MTLEELKAHIADHNEKYGAPESTDLEFENSAEHDSESTEILQTESDSTSHDPRSPHRSTGPRTPAGKAVSSQNATTHGLRSKTLILRHEDPAEYEALHTKWWDHYQPSGQAEETLVKQLIDNHWFCLRASKRMEQVDYGMPEDIFNWTSDQQKLFNNIQRYKTAAERAYQKSFSIVETYLRNCQRDKIAADKADLMRLKIEAQIAQQSSLSKSPEPSPEQPMDPSRPPRKRTPLTEAKARWNLETGGFLGPLSPSSPFVVPSARY